MTFDVANVVEKCVLARVAPVVGAGLVVVVTTPPVDAGAGEVVVVGIS